MAVVVSGYGFSGAIEGTTFNANAACDSTIGCTLQPNTLRINPSLGTTWGENGYGTLNINVATTTRATPAACYNCMPIGSVVDPSRLN